MRNIFVLNQFKKLIGVMLLFCCSFALNAKQIPTVTKTMKTIPLSSIFINVNDRDSIQTSAVGGTADYDIINTVALKYDLNTDTFFLSPATVEVELAVWTWDAGGTPIAVAQTAWHKITIDPRYNRSVIEQSIRKFSGGYKVRVKVTGVKVNGVSVGSLPRYVGVEFDINMDRYYDFSSSVATAVTPLSVVPVIDCDSDTSEVEFTWNPVTGAEEYQVEWAYVNKYSANGGSYAAGALAVDFKNNSTRVTTFDNSYKISMLYEKGFIAFRVRAVGRDYLAPEKYIYGPWSIVNDKPNLGSLSSNELYDVVREHDKLKNWQYSSTFAEEGKKKEVINYFDGSLRNRQTTTKINSDNNVIVGETIYDFQGRPAVSILPVPVVACGDTGYVPGIKYYTKFNVDDTNKVYSKNDFDLDGSGCEGTSAPLDTISGASQYYSNNNPDKSAQQAFLPHAKEYPFTQIEYTADNTGRIRTQTGVGSDYKLGSGKETKYLYGQPNQIQIDRMFGSESGDVANYKKNVTIDANGQTSVTYLNKNGKTVATALAGIPPVDTLGVLRVDSLDYANENQKTLTIDAFNKDIYGNSSLNTLAPSKDEIVFSSQLLVPYKSTYQFRYDVIVDTLGDACLKTGFCIGCVYDFKMEVRDECGQDLAAAALGNPIDWVIGKVDTTGNTLTFDMTCPGAVSQDSAKFNLLLDPGVYTISKILKVNTDARDYFVKKYLDTAYNTCVKTYDDFYQAELAKIDTLDCYNTCASCVAELGSKDDYVSSGRGTAAQWDFLYEECTEPCRFKTLCDNNFEMMLLDVSPGGQYGKYNVVTNDANGEALSMLNSSNVHRSNNLSSGQANWRFPRLVANGNVYNMYLNENGERAKVNVTVTGSTYFPPVVNTSLVYTDTVTMLQYTYPENLLTLADFLSEWEATFARSLVMYHPEYAYYRSCKEHSIKFPGDNFTSDQFDSLLLVSESFKQAKLNGFIDSTNYLTAVPAISKLKPFWLPTGTSIKDPFYTDSVYYRYTTSVNPVTGLQTSVNMTAPPFNFNIQSEITYKMNNYMVIGSIPYSMADVAAMMVRCGNAFAALPAPSCLSFGSDFYSTPTALNDSIRNREWRIFRQLYTIEKQRLQFERMNFYAKYNAGTMSNYYGGCNSCIGATPPYSSYGSGMVVPFYSYAPYSPIFDPSQPCTIWWKYTGSKKRFIDPSKTGLDPTTAAQSLYQSTGQCPLAFQLQTFLSAMADSSLMKSIVTLSTVPEFVPDLYVAMNGGTLPSTFIKYQWKFISTTGGGNILNINVIDSTTNINKCTITFTKTGTPAYSFADITGFSQLNYDPAGTGQNPFKAVVTYTTISGTFSDNVKGNSCLRIKSCTFPPVCTPNQFAVDAADLMTMVRQDTFVTIGPRRIYADTTISPFISLAFKSTLGTPNSKMMYNYVSPDKLVFYDSTNASTKIVFTILSVSPTAPLDSAFAFINIKPNYNNLFTMDGVRTNSQPVLKIEGKAERITSTDTIGISMGECELPESPECDQQEHQVRKDLEKLVDQVLSSGGPYNNVNLFSYSALSPLLQSFLAPGVSATSSNYVSDTSATPNYDTLTFEIDQCAFGLLHYRNNGTKLNFPNIVSVENLNGIGVPDIAGNYFSFSAIATYSTALNTLVKDTIYGQSCWPIKNCPACTGADTVSGPPVPPLTPTYYTPSEPTVDVEYCDSIFKAWKTTVTNFNASAFAITNGYYLNDTLFADSTYFIKAGLCNCAIPYNAYVSAYADTTQPPKELPMYSDCPKIVDNTITDCAALHTLYKNTIRQYNDSVMAGAIPYPLIDTTNTVFTNYGGGFRPYCICANKFIAQLKGLINGASMPLGTDTMKYLTLRYACEIPPCTTPVDSAYTVIPFTKYDNPCVAQQINIAAFNAQNAWQQYMDSMNTAISNLYMNHCLNALENFQYIYDDKEYHFTLYYYDQAGNLVKTIPPEGVQMLNITSSSDAISTKIKSGRALGIQKVYTEHRMPSNYIYNSLNQLVYQSIPDHDNMDLCDGTLPNGLDTALAISSMHFATPSKGYLCGYIQVSATKKRGYVYTTDDAGNYWRRLSGVVSGDIQKIQFAGVDTAYAVSSYGMVLKSVDGGKTWDLLTSLYSPLSSGNKYFDKLNDLYFTNSDDGVVGGIKTSGHGAIYYTTNGGNGFTEATVTGIVNGDTITGFTWDSTWIYASARNGYNGKLFKSNNLSSWSQVTAFAANNLKRVQYIKDTLAFMVGEDGTFIRYDGTDLKVVPTGQYKNFRDVWFRNRFEGIAILDDITTGQGHIYKTFDGGLNWTLLSGIGDDYNSLQGYTPLTGEEKVVASGSGGLVARVLMNSQPFGIIKLGAPAAERIRYTDAFLNDTLGAMTAISLGSNGKIYTTYDAQLTASTWKTFNPGLAAADTAFKKVLISVSDSTKHDIKALVLTKSGKLYGFYQAYGASSAAVTLVNYTSIGGSYFFADITSNMKTDTTDFFGIDTVSKTAFKIRFNGLNAAIGYPLSGVTNGGNITAMDISNMSNKFVVVGNTGNIETGPLSGSSITWTAYTDSIVPNALNRICTPKAANGIVVGDDGSVWKSNATASRWILRNSGTATNLLSIEHDTLGVGLTGGDNGKLFKITNGLGNNPSLSNVATSITAKLTDVAIDTTKAFVTASNGKVIFISDYNTPVVQFAASPGSNSMNGVDFQPGLGAFVVGDQVTIRNFYGLSSFTTKDIFNRHYSSIHFYDANNGYVIDSSRVIRRTTDGGNTWSVILPSTTLPGISKVFATKSNQAILIGQASYAAVANSNVLSTITVPGVSTNLQAIDFNRSLPDYGIIVGGGTRTYSITSTGSTTYDIKFISAPLVAPPTPPAFRSVRVFNDSSFIAAGGQGKIYYYNKVGVAWTQQAVSSIASGAALSTVNWLDIFFHDNYTGYIVGNKGAAIKCKLDLPISTVASVANSIPWQDFCTQAVFPASYNTSAMQSMTFSAVSFPSRSKGIIVGLDNNFLSPLLSMKYAMMVNDQSLYYSSRFWYDKLGRLVLSQNTKQFNKSNPDSANVKQAFSYTLYDELGRITEVGEKFENHDTDGVAQPKMRSIFGSMVSGHYNLNAIDDTKFTNWINAPGSRREVTHTYYDEQSVLPLAVSTQDNLRKRVATVSYEDVRDGYDSTYQHATHYSYDIHGNVKTLWQENPNLAIINQNFKRMDYDYDLISGKVNKVMYQKDSVDQFIHRYDYDADNRITKVETSRDNIVWEQDAKYFYYDHGPLARIEYGKDHVQGYDFAYTLQGWIKGVNSNILDHHADMGKDGDTTSANPNGYFARDVVGYSLGYYQGDYEAVDYNKWNTTSTRFESYLNAGTSNYQGSLSDLYNGNISRMVTTISRPDTNGVSNPLPQPHFPQGAAYRYDQLNRIKKMLTYNNLDTTAGGNIWQSGGYTARAYENRFTYDPNGNINTQFKMDGAGTLMDSLGYKYHTTGVGNDLKRNRLYHVDDLAGATIINSDIEDQGSFIANGDSVNGFNNYKYDEIGNLIHDDAEYIDTITWTVYGKIKSIKYKTNFIRDNLNFDYDAMGNRIAKHAYDSSGTWKRSSYYVRDAQGNTMGIYDMTPIAGPSLSYKLKELDLYGSTRLGVAQPDLEMIGALPGADTLNILLGKKQYELSNHLGNVLTTISDKKLAVNQNTDSIIDYYIADIHTARDYYPFGDFMPERDFSCPVYADTTSLKVFYHQFNDSADVEGWTPFVWNGNWASANNIGDGRLTVRAASNNDGVYLPTTLKAGTTYRFAFDLDIGTENQIWIQVWDNFNATQVDQYFTASGHYEFDFTTSSNPGTGATWFHLMATCIPFDTMTYYFDNILLTERALDTKDYRYTFNGKESDRETVGTSGGTQDYGMRIYNPSLGRFLSIDPLAKGYPWYTPYQFAGNMPIKFIDLDGLEPAEPGCEGDVQDAPMTAPDANGNYDDHNHMWQWKNDQWVNNGPTPDTRTEGLSEPSMISRSEWGANKPNENASYKQVDPTNFYHYIAIHHAGNTNSPSMKNAQEEHLDDNFNDIGYHYGIDLQGNIYRGRPLWKQGATVGQEADKQGVIGIVILADLQTMPTWDDVTSDKLTPQAYQSLIKLVTYLSVKYDIQQIGGHTEIYCGHTVCPGDQLTPLLDDVRKKAQAEKPPCLAEEK